ncbi:MAG: flagellar basal body L-ring protein FlgH [Steroidobacteraceae bacterium]
MSLLLQLFAATSITLLLASCSLGRAPEPDDPDWVEPIETPAAAAGTIYRAGMDQQLFENMTARRVGDILTVRLQERTNASKSAETSTEKSTNIDLPGMELAGRPVTVNGTPILDANLGHSSDFAGKGSSTQSNRLDGDVTVTVVRRLSNGNLLIRGQKWLALNQGREFVRLQGVIRPYDIEPDNSVPSYKVASARIGYGGRGAIASANAPSWLARFFNSPLTPF